jgi:hypothetical protein
MTNCPSCSGFADAPKSENIRRFTLGDGVAHFVPDMWLAGCSSRIERDNRGAGMEAHRGALHEWAGGCAMALDFESQFNVGK